SVVHTVLGKLEEQGLVKAVITQNIDLLHSRGGSKNIIEIHGSPRIHSCPACRRSSMEFDEAARIVQKGELPRCGKCGAVLKPEITFFGENLPVHALARAEKEAKTADLMLILGTSLTVFPAAGLPQITLRQGGKLVIVNDMETPLDSFSALCFKDLAVVFEGILTLIG
ncbi:MAG: NAD-dependent deacetylase, partial [Treponema sp.]|nr:NAD-dependent deacetylase [Treponema sp.]